MLSKNLTDIWSAGKFAPAWIIGASDAEGALGSIIHFSQSIMGCGDLPIENNPDFRIIKRELNSLGEMVKHIAVDQIRELQKFFSTTNSTSQYKIAVIYEADLMNINASNCCLKILEDTPQNSYIFLITSAPNSMLVTIRSRCSILYAKSTGALFDQNSYLESLAYISDNHTFITKLGGKIDKATLHEFGRNIMHYINRLIKNHELTPEEEVCAKGLSNKSTKYILNKFENLKKIIDDARSFDLDPRASFILMVEEVRA